MIFTNNTNFRAVIRYTKTEYGLFEPELKRQSEKKYLIMK